ncbi:hypothetical protein KXW30_002653, partial [Aspergillus fumigatus]
SNFGRGQILWYGDPLGCVIRSLTDYFVSLHNGDVLFMQTRSPRLEPPAVSNLIPSFS